VVAGEGDVGGELSTLDGSGEGGTGGAVANEEGMPGKLRVLRFEDLKGGDEVEVAFFLREAAHHEEDRDASGKAGAGGGNGGGVWRPGFEGVVEDGDAAGGDAEGGELLFKGAADGDEVVRLAEAPAVALVVDALFQAGGGVAVVEGNPGEFAVKAAKGEEEVGFNVVGLDEVRREGPDELADFGEEGRVIGTGFGEDMDGEAGMAGTGN